MKAEAPQRDAVENSLTDPEAEVSSAWPRPWKVGTKTPFMIYDAKGNWVCRAASAPLARQIADLINGSTDQATRPRNVNSGRRD